MQLVVFLCLISDFLYLCTALRNLCQEETTRVAC